jgi:hypothetical protein
MRRIKRVPPGRALLQSGGLSRGGPRVGCRVGAIWRSGQQDQHRTTQPRRAWLYDANADGRPLSAQSNTNGRKVCCKLIGRRSKHWHNNYWPKRRWMAAQSNRRWKANWCRHNLSATSGYLRATNRLCGIFLLESDHELTIVGYRCGANHLQLPSSSGQAGLIDQPAIDGRFCHF